MSRSCGYGHVGLGEQDVHVPRHAAGHRVNRVLHGDALALEHVRELAHGVLCLGDREPVAGHDHHLPRVGQHDGEVVGVIVSRPVCPSAPAATAAPPLGAAPKALKRTFASERFIARPIMIVSSVPEAPTSVPADDERVVVEARSRSRRPRGP